jgi:hypothetical protein
MSYNYTLKYKTFNQLLEEIHVDFQNYNLESFIEPQQLIKVAKRVSYELGLRVLMTKEALVEIHNGKVRLPDDFYVLNYALVCDHLTINEPVIQGTNMQEIPLAPPRYETSAIIDPCTDAIPNCQTCGVPTYPCACPSPSNCLPPPPNEVNCTKPRIVLTCKGNNYELVQVVKTQTRTFRRLWALQFLANDQTIACNCPNLYVKSPNHAWIRDGFLFTNLENANIYISYQGMLEDDEGNLLVPDHDLINEYYEYALKKRILENLIMNDENVSQAKIQLIENGYRTSRNLAMSVVNTPNFAEMKEMWWQNRKAQYGKYYDMFSSYPWNQAFNINVQGQMNQY